MIVVVAYDVNTETAAGRRRLRRIAKTCESYGQRVQYSVFECVVGAAQWARLRVALLREYDPDLDNLRFYFLDEETRHRTEHHGTGRPIDLEGPLIA